MVKFNLDKFIDNLMMTLKPKQQIVIGKRFGLKNGEKATLQNIGDVFGITRERVRQIEAQILKNISPSIKEGTGEILELVNEHLDRLGGVRRDEEFLNDLRYFLSARDVKCFEQKIKFILEISEVPFYYREDQNFYSFWYLNEEKKENFFEFIRQFINFLKSQDKAAVLEKKIHLEKLKELLSSHSHFLAVSKKIGFNNFGDLGLTEWPEIQPRTIRDKIYLVLKKHGQPLHFGHIAKNIQTFGIDTKPAHVQTVHNELVKDERFVLVGRGLYGLKEHGFEPGTVREVIVKILKNKKALSSSEIMKQVKQKKFVKDTTILLNLQNKEYFRRSPDGHYSLVSKSEVPQKT